MQPAVACSILLFFSWGHNNIGDIGITPGTLRLIERHIPEAEVTLVALSKADDTRAYLKTRFPRCKVIPTPFNKKEMPDEFRKVLGRADLVLYNSGTTLSWGRWAKDWNRTMKLAMPLVAARDAGKPYGIYCQSFEKFAWPSNLYFKPLLDNAAFVFTRDTNSLAYLKSLGISPPVMEYGPDGTFAFDLRDEAAADRFMKQHKLQNRKFITVTIRTSRQGFIDQKREEAHAAKLREMIKTWVEQTGHDVLICPEVRFEIEPARRLIYDRLPPEVLRHVRFKDDFWLPDEAFSVYARAEAIVSMEMHSIILAMAAGTPVIHPRFAEAGRKAWMLEDLGVGQWLFDIDKEPAAKFTAELLAINKDFDAALATLAKAMTVVHKRQAETMAVVRKAIHKNRKEVNRK